MITMGYSSACRNCMKSCNLEVAVIQYNVDCLQQFQQSFKKVLLVNCLVYFWYQLRGILPELNGQTGSSRIKPHRSG